MRDEVILIGAYCPDDRRKKVLETLLLNLKLNYPKADLLVHSRSFLPEKIITLADKVIIDNENPLLPNQEFKSQLWWGTDQHKISSSFFNPRSNTHLASTYNFFNSWNYGKYLGYSKIYYIEYDVIIKDFSIFQEAKSYLEEYDAVIYSRNSTYLYPFFAFNGKANIPSYYQCYKTSVKYETSYLKDSIKKGITSEEMGVDLFKNSFKDKVIFPEISNKCKVVIDSTPVIDKIWNWVVVDNFNLKVFCTIHNPSTETQDNNVIFKLNDKLIHTHKSSLISKGYRILETPFTLDDLTSLEVITLDHTDSLVFTSSEDRNLFLTHNFLTKP